MSFKAAALSRRGCTKQVERLALAIDGPPEPDPLAADLTVIAPDAIARPFGGLGAAQWQRLKRHLWKSEQASPYGDADDRQRQWKAAQRQRQPDDQRDEKTCACQGDDVGSGSQAKGKTMFPNGEDGPIDPTSSLQAGYRLMRPRTP